jgi:predicted SAM-dependent methyltransferase
MAVRFRRQLVPGEHERLRLHIGCGERQLDGWVNIDLAGACADYVWDLRRPLPVEPGSVDAIFHEHFLEHLPLEAALGSLRECHRLLAPGGTIRIGVPDFGRHVRSYLDQDGFLEQIRPGRPAPIFAINELVYSYGHRSMWDATSLLLALTETGFDQVLVQKFGESRLVPAPDTPERRLGTIYVEAVKPHPVQLTGSATSG